MPLIECVPNVSEGRRADVIAALGAAIAVPGVHVLDQSSDPSHNRTVFTFVGEPAPLQDAVLRLFSVAIDAIDLRSHDGVHPRMGAVDVVPFIPLNGATMQDCVELAKAPLHWLPSGLAFPYSCTRMRQRMTSVEALQKSGEAARTVSPSA